MQLLRKYLALFFWILNLSFIFAVQRDKISLAGQWQLHLDTANNKELAVGDIRFTDVIRLPASLDEAKKGRKAKPSSSTHRMQRRYSYYGKAYYKREILIPETWKNKEIELFIERTRPTQVWIDGKWVGNKKNISAPQTYNLTQFLTPGKHALYVMVDNGPDCGLPSEIASSHMWSDDTQTNWNGLLGEICLNAKPLIYINAIKTNPDIQAKKLGVQLSIDNLTENVAHCTLLANVAPLQAGGENTFREQRQAIIVNPGRNEIRLNFSLVDDVKPWSEYAPNLYKLNIQVEHSGTSIDQMETSFGFRSFKAEDQQFTLNGNPVFLRGKHDACVFPLTGYAPMELDQWIAYFNLLKTYGFNHVRFHSWCPPEAAFEAADMLGFYLQPELPYWGNIENNPHDPVNTFLLAEGKAVLDAFANHPSMIMFSTGNELWGNLDGLKFLTRSFREYDDRPLYTHGSNYHLGWAGEQDGEDFMVVCRVGGHNDLQFEPHVRSSFSFADAVDGGLLNARYPNTSKTFEKGTSMASKPVVSHETGQFQMLPDAKELDRYTGVLSPVNLKILTDRVKNKLGHRNYQNYFDASAALSLLCYKADLEMMRRTPGLAGFQMLDIQDFPGQGTAIVGILNALMQSKNIISAEEFRSWNNDVMPLWIADSYTFYNNSPIRGQVQISNHTTRNINGELLWTLKDTDGGILRKGKIPVCSPAGRLSESTALEIPLPPLEKATACNLEIAIGGTAYKNSYPLWIYPADILVAKPGDSVRFFTRFNDELIHFLSLGAKAILMPETGAYPDQTVKGLFTSDYWNFSMFKTISENAKKPVSPGTIGLLIQNQHPLFREFPTGPHSNWQWWPIVKNSTPLILDNLIGKIRPIVESIDNAERVHFLATMFECNVGPGRLFVSMSDLNNQSQYKESRQFYNALLNYVNSPAFTPATTLTTDELKKLFTEKPSLENIEGVPNISYDE